jgi:SAM-dependent methyltransferase
MKGGGNVISSTAILSTTIGTTLGYQRAAALFQRWDNGCNHRILPRCGPPQRRLPLQSTRFDQPDNSQFGRQDYWNQFYQEQAQFSWYAGWDDLQPFVQEFVAMEDSILIPGVGNDAQLLVDMYQAGYTQLTAMDYASEGIARCRDMLQEARILPPQQEKSSSKDENTKRKDSDQGVSLLVADARDLGNVFQDHSFHSILEKGTLDAIFLSGGQNKTLALENLNLAISELGRCLKPGGIWISIAAVVDAQIQSSMDSLFPEWEFLVRRNELFVTKDGYTSNNIDGSLLVWRKRYR